MDQELPAWHHRSITRASVPADSAHGSESTGSGHDDARDELRAGRDRAPCFELDASPGDALSFATMLAATNDVFLGPEAEGLALFGVDGTPVTGDVTDEIPALGRRHEANEMPAIGSKTVTNQLSADSGEPGGALFFIPRWKTPRHGGGNARLFRSVRRR